MLTLLMVLLAGQDATVRPAPTARAPLVAIKPLETADLGAIIRSPPVAGCAPMVHVVSPSPGRDVRNGDGRVRMYLLLERRVDGCSVPLVAAESLPDADRAIGLEIPVRGRP